MAELVPRADRAGAQRRGARHRPHHRRRGSRPPRAVARRVRRAVLRDPRSPAGTASGWRCRPTRSARWR
ncbi:MAG: hypothetical protein MZV49_17175 [Rhodopseudomonas palustris]|nr:hypothetical protein [Rhodopseudomonas palustris]